MTTRHLLLRSQDVSEGDVVGRVVGGVAVAVCRVDGRLSAFQDACTHYNWPLSKGFVHEGRIFCSLHMAAFDPETGACVEPPATCPLTTYDLEIDGEDVYISLEEPAALPKADPPPSVSTPPVKGVRPIGPPGWAARRAAASDDSSTL